MLLAANAESKGKKKENKENKKAFVRMLKLSF